jgi:hypothetical protein
VLCFWIRPGDGKRIHDLIAWFHLNHRKFGFTQAFTLDSGPGGLEKVREWCHPHIEGTGEVAAVFMDQNVLSGSGAHVFLVSNSGPFIKEIVDLRYGKGGHRSVLSTAFFHEAMRQIPPSTNAFAFVQGRRLREVLEGYRAFYSRRFNDQVMDPIWEAEQRPDSKLVVLRRVFPGRSENSLSADEMRKFNEAVEAELKKRWVAVLPQFSTQSQGGVDDLMNLVAPLHASYVHFRFDPQWIALQARLAVSEPR